MFSLSNVIFLVCVLKVLKELILYLAFSLSDPYEIYSDGKLLSFCYKKEKLIIFNWFKNMSAAFDNFYFWLQVIMWLFTFSSDAGQLIRFFFLTQL